MKKLETKILSVIVVVLFIGCFFAISVVAYLHRASLFEISTIRASETADIIADNIRGTMLAGDAMITKTMVNDLRNAQSIQDINVYNSEGREAFSSEGAPVESDALEKLRRNREKITDRRDDSLIIYKPLMNREECQSCHSLEEPLLGAVKIVIPLHRENQKVASMLGFSVGASLVAVVGLSVILIIALRRLVIQPVNSIEQAASLLAEGDLSFAVNGDKSDEIGRLSRSIKDSLYTISGVLRKIGDVSSRVSSVAADVEKESDRVLQGTEMETDAIENISTSVEEMTASMSEISDGTDSLVSSVGEIAGSMEEMSASIGQINSNTSNLFSAVEDTSASIEEMSATMKTVSEHTQKLTETSEDTFSALEELDASIKEVDRNAKESSTLSDKLVDNATQVGLHSIDKTIEGMGRIKKTVESTADLIRKLENRSHEVGKILNVIDEITEQTNLLALNAAILASQAGEHGKGFSVVADEIKDLAERTSFSTQEISTLIGAVQKEVSEAIRAMDEGVESVETGFKLARESGEAFKTIVDGAKKSSEMSTAIEKATEQQTNAVALVTESMENVRNIIFSVSRATAEQTKGASLIMHATEKVREITAQVKNASEEQTSSSSHIVQIMDSISEKTKLISNALHEQKSVARLIKESVHKIRLLPEQNKQIADTLNKSLKELSLDAEIIIREMQRFTLQDEETLDP